MHQMVLRGTTARAVAPSAAPPVSPSSAQKTRRQTAQARILAARRGRTAQKIRGDINFTNSQVALLTQKFSSTLSDSPETSSASLELSPEVRTEGKTRVTGAAGSDILKIENPEVVNSPNPPKEYPVFSINRKFYQMATPANTVDKRIADKTLPVEAVPVIQAKGVDATTGTRAPLGKEGEISCGEKSPEYQGQSRRGERLHKGERWR